MVAQIPEEVKNVMTRLEAAGYQAWCVGGAVRDLLLGRTPGDWDVTTNALPETVLELFAPRALPTGLKHGTVTVGGGRGVEVTTFRKEGTYSDHRHPDLSGAGDRKGGLLPEGVAGRGCFRFCGRGIPVRGASAACRRNFNTLSPICRPHRRARLL